MPMNYDEALQTIEAPVCCEPSNRNGKETSERPNTAFTSVYTLSLTRQLVKIWTFFCVEITTFMNCFNPQDYNVTFSHKILMIRSCF